MDKTLEEQFREAFEEHVDEEIADGACSATFGGQASCAKLILETIAFENVVIDMIEVIDDVKSGEVDADTAINLIESVCKPCKAGTKLGKKLKDITKRCSFEGDTLVLTNEGYKPISQIQIGDYVWSKDDDNTGEWGWKPVTDAYSHIHQDGLILSIQKADGTELTITTTAEHPFYSNGVWYRADQLQVGMGLTTPDGTLKLLAIAWLEQELPAYNLTVGQTHTYTVGKQMVWVHNKCGEKLTPDDLHPDFTGRNHLKDFPDVVPDKWSQSQIKEAIENLKSSIKQRKKDIKHHGDNDKLPGHHERLRREENFLKKLEKKI